jgi:hypothetical protein
MNEKIDSLNMATIAKQSQGLGQKEGIGQVAVIAGLVATLVALIARFIK